MDIIGRLFNWFKSPKPQPKSRLKRLPRIPPTTYNENIVRNSSQSPAIFQLTIDCCNAIFEYLSLNDLYSIGQTCHVFQLVAGEYFKRNFSSSEIFCCYDGVYTTYSDHEGVTNQRINISNFSSFITHMSNYYHVFGPHYYIYTHSNEFTAINRINLVDVSLNRDRVKYIQTMLMKIEVLEISRCKFDDGFHENLLKYCVNLRRLHVHDDLEFVSEAEKWLGETYPNLEHLELITRSPYKIHKVVPFLRRNKSLRSFSTSSCFLQFNQYQLLKSNIELHVLEVEDINDQIKCSVDGMNVQSIYDILNKLYKSGFYKSLRLKITNMDEECSNQLLSIHGLDGLYIKNFSKSFSLIHMINLKELNIFNDTNVTEVEILAKSLLNLTRVYLKNFTCNEILPFVFHSPKLQVLQLFPKHLNGGILDLNTLNKEREQLHGAQKVLIYVPDDIFLATKWTTKHGNINLSFVEMKRIDSIMRNF